MLPIECQMLMLAPKRFVESELSDISLIDWRAHKIAGAVGSTLASETSTVKNGLGQAVHARNMMYDIIYRTWSPRVADTFVDPRGMRICAVTDCASLWDHIEMRTKAPKDARTRIPILIARDDLKKPSTGLKWSPTACMLADVGTKPNSIAKPDLGKVMSGSWRWIAPKDAAETVSDANHVSCLAAEHELEDAECLLVSGSSASRVHWLVMILIQ